MGISAYVLLCLITNSLRRGVVVNGVRHMNEEATVRRARLVLGRVTAGIPPRYVTSQLGQLSRGR